MTSNNSLVLPLAMGEVGEHNVNAGVDANGPPQPLQQLPDGETLSRWIPVSNSRGSRPLSPRTPSDDRQVPVENINEGLGREREPSRPIRQARGGLTRTRSSHRIRTRERQRLRINQSSPSRESSSQSTEAEQLPSTSVNLIMETENSVNQSNEQPITHDSMYHPYDMDDASV